MHFIFQAFQSALSVFCGIRWHRKGAVWIETERSSLLEGQRDVTCTILFLLFAVLSLLLALQTALWERESLDAQLEGRTPRETDSLPLSWGSAALEVGGGLFFLCLAWKNQRSAPAEERRAAGLESAASLLTLLAALLRFLALESGTLPTDDTLP